MNYGWNILKYVQSHEVIIGGDSLKCLITKEKLSDPVRGIHCKHIECYEKQNIGKLVSERSKCIFKGCNQILSEIEEDRILRILLRQLPNESSALRISDIDKNLSYKWKIVDMKQDKVKRDENSATPKTPSSVTENTKNSDIYVTSQVGNNFSFKVELLNKSCSSNIIYNVIDLIGDDIGVYSEISTIHADYNNRFKSRETEANFVKMYSELNSVVEKVNSSPVSNFLYLKLFFQKLVYLTKVSSYNFLLVNLDRFTFLSNKEMLKLIILSVNSSPNKITKTTTMLLLAETCESLLKEIESFIQVKEVKKNKDETLYQLNFEQEPGLFRIIYILDRKNYNANKVDNAIFYDFFSYVKKHYSIKKPSEEVDEEEEREKIPRLWNLDSLTKNFTFDYSHTEKEKKGNLIECTNPFALHIKSSNEDYSNILTSEKIDNSISLSFKVIAKSNTVKDEKMITIDNLLHHRTISNNLKYYLTNSLNDEVDRNITLQEYEKNIKVYLEDKALIHYKYNTSILSKKMSTHNFENILAKIFRENSMIMTNNIHNADLVIRYEKFFYSNIYDTFDNRPTICIFEKWGNFEVNDSSSTETETDVMKLVGNVLFLINNYESTSKLKLADKRFKERVRSFLYKFLKLD